MTSQRLPATADDLRAQARQLIDSRQWGAAQATLEALVQRLPADVAARMELAGLMLARGQLRASTAQLLQAVRVLPANAPLIIELVPRLCLQGETLAARACLDFLDRAPAPPANVLAAQARLRWMVGEIPKAMALVERAVAAGADTPDDHFLHGLLLQFSGAIGQAGEVLDACLRRWPRFGAAAVVRSNLRRQTPQTQHLDFLREQLCTLPAESKAVADRSLRAELESALFKELDDLGRHDQAWPSLARSNALMHALHPYDAAGETAITEALLATSNVIGTTHTSAASEPDGPVPIFIVGMPRSGTTLLDRMLSNHSQVTSAGEINAFPCQLRWAVDVPSGGAQRLVQAIERSPGIDFAELGARYLKQTRWLAQGRRFYIDKLPINIRMVPLIRRALPHAPILHMVRNPMDVCFSNLKILFGGASPYSYDMQALAHYHGQYMRLVDHWRATLPGAMLDVPYASLVGDPEASLARVLRHCGLPMEEACLRPERNAAPVATRSTAQVGEPIHTRSLGEWRHYAQQLEPLRLALGVG